MSVVQKNYITVQSRVKPKYEHPTTVVDGEDEPDLSADPTPPQQPILPTMTDDNVYVTSKAVAKLKLPDWFTNAQSKYKKIVRVLGSTINFINTASFIDIEVIPPTPGYRLFSNVSTHSNIVMKTVTVEHGNPLDPSAPKFVHTSSPEGFVMMINNYNSVKEYDITYENIREIKFYLRPWNSVTTENSFLDVDFVCELELLLIDENH
jgi:hypothetical protein